MRVSYPRLGVFISAAIAVVLLAVGIWAARPPRIYAEWLGLVGSPDDSPIARLRAWVEGDRAPVTPSGCLSLFEATELFFAGMLLLSLVLLVTLLVATRRGSRLGLRLAAPVASMRAIPAQLRVRGALAAIAVAALYLGWEVDAWRAWQVQDVYRRKAAVAAALEDDYRSRLRSTRQQLDQLDAFPTPPGDSSQADGVRRYRSAASLAAYRAVLRGDLEREASFRAAMVTAYARRRLEYERVVREPRKPLSPDPPLPEPEPSASDWLNKRDFARALAAYDKLSRVHPDLVEAHLELARIRAMCTDPRYRDGGLAVRSSTRACELTNWGDTECLEVLAAAHAEGGNFADAVKLQQELVDQTATAPNADRFRKRLALYRSGKPYRGRR